MPGIVVFRRRWSVGSDDLVVPGLFLFIIHLIWLIVLAVVTGVIQYDRSIRCIELLWFFQVGYLGILGLCALLELAICIVSMRGSILDTGPRVIMPYLLYIRILVMLLDLSWLILGIIWMKDHYLDCPIQEPKETMLAVIICNLLVIFSMFTTIWCTFDPAGRSWVKMKKYQRSMRESESRFNYKRSGSRSRNWRQRKVIRAYQDSWDHRCRLLFCCMGNSDRSRNSFTDIARLLSDFFRDLDVVPSDVVAGLVLLRKFQKLEREAIVRQRKNGTYEFLSGVPITANTQFLALNDSKDYDHFQTVIRYMYFAQGAYGWPMFLMTHSQTGVCQLGSELSCCLSCCRRKTGVDVVEDNCCFCNYAALKKMLQVGEIEVIYATYHVDIGETPFFVAVDYSHGKVVVSIRGTLSMKDVLTDLNAEGECLPLTPPREDWLGHKGMVQAAIYIKNKLEEENLIQRALTHNPTRGTQDFGLILVGHSLGAGTAAILAILMKQQYDDLHCYSYSPPGGLLSMPAVEYSKTFITSVVVGKDVVPRIGLHQMESLRADLINAIQRSVDPKWKTIACSVICCCCGPEPTSVTEMSNKVENVQRYEQDRNSARQSTVHPNDNSIALTLHHPLYPPGRIIHIVRHHPSQADHKYEKGWRQMLKKHEPVYQAIWANNTDFDEVLISPVMLQDHMPDKVLAALNKVITTVGPRKPQRQSSNANSSIASDAIDALLLDGQQINAASLPTGVCSLQSPASPTVPHKICLETSFTSLQSPQEHNLPSKPSSMAGSILGVRSQLSSIVDDSGIPKSLSGPSEATTVIFNDPNQLQQQLQPQQPRASSSASNATTAPKMVNFSDSPTNVIRSDVPASSQTKPNSLSWNGVRQNSFDIKKIDLIHDDWFGLAPLASPESLSELSSISSRASFGANLASSIDRYLEKISESKEGNTRKGEGSDPLLESQLHTPKIMRRTPKVSGNLSMCAEDMKTINSYKRMGKIFMLNRAPSDSDSTVDSYESAHNVIVLDGNGFIGMEELGGTAGNSPTKENSKSADNLDDLSTRPSTAGATTGCGGGVGTKKTSFTVSDSAIQHECISNCPSCPCRRSPGGPCCQKFNHRDCYNYKYTSFNIFKFNNSRESGGSTRDSKTASSSDTYHSAVSSLMGDLDHSGSSTNNVISSSSSSSRTLQNTCLKPGVLESHFPVYPETISDERLSLLSNTNDSSPVRLSTVATINSQRFALKGQLSSPSVSKRHNDDDLNSFTRNESLPLLANLVEKSSPTKYARKKHSAVYPSESGHPIATAGFSAGSSSIGGGSIATIHSSSSYSSVASSPSRKVTKNESNV
ncbi:diacylglycerol lipase-alpha isoform X1 [Malaya genurostris]|uniref:diacylglycerol lipase-alpha isoform X1 n=1 Tax=Malaya genurostris TaxID=325434 RepID=UPI0026F3A17A|nr:diacylglycerol lipase-alpha isoform X1 [Malaya genurostris]XP_058444463.1 diacylglycerol lipase-alpha isoform X1 [Malaya genurostris]XP_058444464.1 diacylglycerol lipase-alpha isoform X1 [Malaya genurostris]XP_058444465.1 diacylglycerol lipase-alpha isoform X1 [Malaya genurostris]